MIRLAASFTAAVLVAALTWLPAAAQIAIENVNVLTMTDQEVREGWTVLVEGDRITAVGPADDIEVPADAQRIDGTGKFLIPGLAEMHGHIPPPGNSVQYVEDILFLFIAKGITTVRGMLGAPGQLELRARANAGEIDSPTLYLSAPSFSGNSVDSPEHAVELVRRYASEGWDYLKVHPGVNVDEYDAMARTANEEGIPFIGHVPSSVGLRRAIEAGQQTVDHLDGYLEYMEAMDGPIDPVRLEEVVQLTLEHDVCVIPTMALWETILGVNPEIELQAYEELRYVPANMREDWARIYRNRRSAADFDQVRVDQIAANRIELLRALNEAGACILMGTDAPQQYSVPGFSLYREFPLMVAAGMSPYEILGSGTRTVGEYFADKDDFGTIEEGKRADLILLNRNPFENVMNALDNDGVMVRGRWYSAEDIEQRLEEIADRSSS